MFAIISAYNALSIPVNKERAALIIVGLYRSETLLDSCE